MYYNYTGTFSYDSTHVEVGDETSYTLQNLWQEKWVHIWVTASNDEGESEPSVKTAVKTQKMITPSSPIQNTPVVRGNTVAVSWTASEGATGYTVYYNYTGTFSYDSTHVEVGDETSYTLQNLWQEKWVHIWVTASNKAGESDPSEKTAVKTQKMTVPDVPVQGEPTVAENSITVNWERALMASKYIVYYGTEDDIENAESVVVGDVLSYTLTDLAYATQYYIWVVANNIIGTSDPSIVKITTTEESTAIVKNNVSYEILTVNAVSATGTVAVAGYTGTDMELTIPTTIVEDEVTYTITEIGKEAFIGQSFTSISLPNSITVIREGAFKNCSSLATMTSHD